MGKQHKIHTKQPEIMHEQPLLHKTELKNCCGFEPVNIY